MAQPAHLEGLVETGKGAMEALNNALFTVSQLADLVSTLNDQIDTTVTTSSCLCASHPGNSSTSTIHIESLTEARKDAMDALNNALVAASRIADLVGSLNRQIVTTKCVCQSAGTSVTGMSTMQSSTTSDGTAVVARQESEGQAALAAASASGDKPLAEHDTLAAAITQSQRDVTVEVKEETEDVEVEERHTPMSSPRKHAENSAPMRQTQMCEKFIKLLRDQPRVELMVLKGLEDLTRAEKVKRKPGRPRTKRTGADRVLFMEGYREKMIEKRREQMRRNYIKRRDKMLRQRLENQRSQRQRRSCTAKVTTYSELAEKREVQVKKEVYI